MLTCLISCLWLCLTWIYVFMRFSPCFTLRSTSVHVYMPRSVFYHVYVLISTCLLACLYPYMSRSMFSHACVLGSMFFTYFMLVFHVLVRSMPCLFA